MGLRAEDVLEFLSAEVFVTRPLHVTESNVVWPGRIGIETEMFPLKVDTPVPTYPHFSIVQKTIEALAREKGYRLEHSSNPEGKAVLTKVTLDKGDLLTFEPGGQIEFSSVPYPCLNEVYLRTKSMQNLLKDAFARDDFELLQIGVNPWHSLDEIPLAIDKRRYHAMTNYFSRRHPEGLRMMRQTATTQVCLDFGENEKSLTQRYVVSQLLSPFLYHWFAHAPFLEGKTSPHKSLRKHIWRNTDPSRTGLVNLAEIIKKGSKQACVEAYFDFLMQSKVIFDKHDRLFEIPPTFQEWMEGSQSGEAPGLSELKVQLTLLFPETRPKGFLEIRSIDSQAPVWQEIPAILLSGLLYDEQSLDQAFELLTSSYQAESNSLDLVEDLSDRKFSRLSQELFRWAREGAERLPTCYRESSLVKKLDRFYEHFTARGRAPQNDILDAVTRSNSNQLSMSLLRNVHDSWCKVLNS